MKQETTVLVYSPKDVDTYARQLADAGLNLCVITASTRAEAEAHVAEAEVLLASNKFPVDLLARASRLRWIHVQGAGVNVWVDHGIPDGVRMSRTTGTFGPRMAQYALTYVGVIVQSVRELLIAQARQEWIDPPIIPLAERTLGIAGVGAIGSAVARLAKAFGMRVIGLSRTLPPEAPLDAWYKTEQILAFASELDFMIIVLPLTPATRGLIDRRVLDAMPEHAWLVNMGRGPLVVEADLLAALRDRQIGGAVLDVFDQEPLPADHPFWSMENVIVTPHSAGGTFVHEVVATFAENLQRWRRGEALVNEVDMARAY